MRRWPIRSRPSRGQALVEFALVFPIAMLLIAAIISLGLWVFYQQMVTNVAREAARYAAIHSSTSICPTSSWRDPLPGPWKPFSYKDKPFNCDGPDNPNDPYPWPYMTDYARGYVWGTAPTAVFVNACWSGYIPPDEDPSLYADFSATSGFPQADSPAVEPDGSGGTIVNQFVQCTIDGRDPTTEAAALDCRSAMTTAADDPASNIPGNQVTAYACFDWSPPMAGFVMIPEAVTMRAVITEVIHRQQ